MYVFNKWPLNIKCTHEIYNLEVLIISMASWGMFSKHMLLKTIII